MSALAFNTYLILSCFLENKPRRYGGGIRLFYGPGHGMAPAYPSSSVLLGIYCESWRLPENVRGPQYVDEMPDLEISLRESFCPLLADTFSGHSPGSPL